VAIGKIIEEREREKAKERMVDAHSSENFSQLGTGRTRDIVGAALGMSGPTYEAAKTVVNLAEADPETYGPRDRTGHPRPALQKVRAWKSPGR
jgi:ParB family chromosome partitioning protein